MASKSAAFQAAPTDRSERRRRRKEDNWFNKRAIIDQISPSALPFKPASRLDFIREAEKTMDPALVPGPELGDKREDRTYDRDSIAAQVEHFPFLRAAPMDKGLDETKRAVFNPVGIQLRHVKCPKCGRWGHGLGDRACPLSDVCLSSDTLKTLEDPFAVIGRGDDAAGTNLRAAIKQEIKHSSNAPSVQRDDDEIEDIVYDSDMRIIYKKRTRVPTIPPLNNTSDILSALQRLPNWTELKSELLELAQTR